MVAGWGGGEWGGVGNAGRRRAYMRPSEPSSEGESEESEGVMLEGDDVDDEVTYLTQGVHSTQMGFWHTLCAPVHGE